MQSSFFLITLLLSLFYSFDVYWVNFGNGKVLSAVGLSFAAGCTIIICHWDFSLIYLIRARELGFLYRVYSEETRRRKLKYNLIYAFGLIL